MVDLDVDILSEGVTCVCQPRGFPALQHHSPISFQQTQNRQKHESPSPWTDGEQIGLAHAQQMHANNNLLIPPRSRMHSPPGVPMASNAAIVPIYQSHGIPYSTQLPVWDPTTSFLSSGQNPFIHGSNFPLQPPPTHSSSQHYGDAEMELSQSDRVEWGFQPNPGSG